MRRSLAHFSLTLLVAAVAAATQVKAPPRVSYLAYERARPILESLKADLPPELRDALTNNPATAWAEWAARRDRDIRARLNQGDEDSVVNFLLFGTSFTARPRITLADLARAGQKADSDEAARAFELIQARADDLVQAVASGADNERVLFARHLFEAKGYDLKSAAAARQMKIDLLKALARVLSEQVGYARLLEAARLQGDASNELVVRSQLFKGRGLSSDTSLMPNFAIERSLASLKAKGLLAPQSVRRVAIVGPGLDFTDKQDGYDFYPQQTIQPFAVIDSLRRLGLAKANDLRVVTLDLSPRINEHLTRARARAAGGTPYVVQLPRDERWTAELLAYWSKFGDQIGAQVAAVKPPAALGPLQVRAVSIRPAFVSLISSADVDIVLQHLELAPAERFDLVIATNILVYYDTFEQSLALANIEQMLRPGGLLLSNNALLELPSSKMRSVGYESVAYSDRNADGDHIVWYQRQAP
ncbi:MAG TPA: class I SAM-dependent methyltransferase [Blastocatellia bacterium]|nr:class I SAM-dependent methyltransferase [Blastocatellia bacterium]